MVIALWIGSAVLLAGGVVALVNLAGDSGSLPAAHEQPSARTQSSDGTGPGVSGRRYAAQSCRSISDSTTSLEWYVGPDEDTSWDDAVHWVGSLTTCGVGWRLPSVGELKTLYDAEHTAGTGYFRDGQHFPAKLNPAFAAIGGGSWVWSDSQADAQAVAYNFFTNGPARMAKDGTAPGNKPRFTTRAFAVRGSTVCPDGARWDGSKCEPVVAPSAVAAQPASTLAPGSAVDGDCRNVGCLRGQVRVGSTVATVAVTNANQVIAQMTPGFRQCYQQGLNSNSGMSGKVVISIKVGPTGEVQTVDQLSNSGLSAQVVSCIQRNIRNIQFASPGANGSTIQLPINFAQE